MYDLGVRALSGKVEGRDKEEAGKPILVARWKLRA
jgi:hypothetical protein